MALSIWAMLRFSASLASGEPETVFLARETEIQLEHYSRKYERDLKVPYYLLFYPETRDLTLFLGPGAVELFVDFEEFAWGLGFPSRLHASLRDSSEMATDDGLQSIDP